MRRQRGVAGVLVCGIVAVALTVIALEGRLAQAALTRARVTTAADCVALAAAQRLDEGANAHAVREVARNVARVNRVALDWIDVESTRVDVTVSRRVDGATVSARVAAELVD